VSDRYVELLALARLAANLGLPATTFAQLVGHADAGFEVRVHARDRRDTAAIVGDL
jgi:hypothetical protein